MTASNMHEAGLPLNSGRPPPSRICQAATTALVCRMTFRICDSHTILIVEDRAVVGAAISDVLTDAGYRVVGPVGSTADALATIADNRIDAALLDIHLGGDDFAPRKDTRLGRPVQTAGSIMTIPFLGGLHHQYARMA